ncbi:MAG TPA: glycosyltransferase 87 family protein [Thermoanaerobaculia bacterium]|nr:glycosyltransferase 87 family protein [Thermoanaerobaculia bacterium]
MSRYAVFAVALLIRAAIAFVFFGSIDVNNAMADAAYLLGGTRPSALGVPYLPGVHLLIWTAGMLAFHTALPAAFVFKLAGCVFDAAIAAMLFDAQGPRTGWLYAFAPVPILIFAVHGQWDSICFALLLGSLLLLRRDGNRAAFAAGVLFVLAAIVKPVAVPIFFLFLERKRIAAIVGGMAACVAAWLVALWLAGDPFSLSMVERVVRYTRNGVTYFGAPFALGISENRLILTIVPVVVLVPLFWKGYIKREHAVLLFYAFVLATCGLSAQYLVWIVPFLLLRGHHRYAALYSLVAGVFLVTFYVSPFGGFSGYNFENLAAFAPLKTMAWLTPTAANAPLKLDIVRALGDYAIPLVCIGMFFLRWRDDESRPASASPLVIALAFVTIMAGAAATLSRPTFPQFIARLEKKLDAYNMATYRPPHEKRQLWVIPRDTRAHPFAATNLAYVWVLAWSVVSAARGAAARDR